MATHYVTPRWACTARFSMLMAALWSRSSTSPQSPQRCVRSDSFFCGGKPPQLLQIWLVFFGSTGTFSLVSQHARKLSPTCIKDGACEVWILAHVRDLKLLQGYHGMTIDHLP